MHESDLKQRLDELTAQIDRLKADLAHGIEPEIVDRLMEFGSILHRHREITRRSGEAEAGRARPETAADLAADLTVVEENLRGWIERSAKARHR